jgi:hypothetical protein
VIDAVALLLADRSPALRFRALVEVDGLPLDDAEVAALAKQLASSGEVGSVVAQDAQELHAMSFALCRLDFFGLTRGHPAVDDLAERVFASQKKDGSWPYFGYASADRKSRVPADEGYKWRPLQVALPLRGLVSVGYATDPRAERAFEWLLAHRFDDGSWPYGQAGVQKAGAVAGYRKLPRSEGCRATTTGALACLARHPERRTSDDARMAMDLLLQRETRDEWALGAEVSRLAGVERPRGFATFYARHDLAFILDLASRMGVSAEDPRVADLVGFLRSKRGERGLWDHPTHPQLSRWLTLDILASMRRLESGDWTGRDLRSSFRPYPKARRRY